MGSMPDQGTITRSTPIPAANTRPARFTLSLFRVVQLLAAWLIVQTTVSVLLTFFDYFPPNFRADFLLGRQAYFFGPYRWAFYAHILAGPFTLVAGLVLLSSAFRRRWPGWHRRLGRVQVLLVLLILVPSGLWMAAYAMTGAIAATGLATLAIATGYCTLLGWRTAVARRFDAHRRWMQRSYALLASAVVLRMIGGLSEVFGLEGTYPLAAWVSWILPLVGLEIFRHCGARWLGQPKPDTQAPPALHPTGR